MIVRIASGREDLPWANGLADHLRTEGFQVADEDDFVELDATVAVLSDGAIGDPKWRTAVEGATGSRLVPVQLHPTEVPDDPDLQELRIINWIQPAAGPPEATYPLIALVLRSNPELYSARRRLAMQADSWAGANRPADLLVDSRKYAGELRALVAQLAGDPLLQPNKLMSEFVDGSVKRSQRRLFLLFRRGLRATAVVVLLGLLLGTVLPRLREEGRQSFNSLTAMDAPDMRGQTPEWFAVMATSVLMSSDGPVEDGISRITIHKQLALPWSEGYIFNSFYEGLNGSVPFGATSVGVVFAKGDGSSNFGVYDMDGQKLRWSMQLPKEMLGAEVSPEGAFAVTLGDFGPGILDLQSRDLREVSPPVKAEIAKVDVGGETASLASFGGQLWNLDVRSAEASKVAKFDDLFDMVALKGGGTRAAVRNEDQYGLVDAATGEMLVEVPIPEDVIAPSASPVPDDDALLFVGEDDQVWKAAADSDPRPTGISVQAASGGIQSLANGRVVVGGILSHPEVYDVATGASLGEVCRDTASLRSLHPSADGLRMSCSGDRATTIWPLPDQRVAVEQGLLSDQARSVSKGYVLVADGDNVKVSKNGTPLADIEMSAGKVVALSLSQEGRSVLIGTDEGVVFQFENVDGEFRHVLSWHTPDRSPVVSVGWLPGPVVATGSGAAWRVPTCDRCLSDAGLIDEVKERVRSCWSDEQLKNVESRTRDRLAIRVCD